MKKILLSVFSLAAFAMQGQTQFPDSYGQIETRKHEIRLGAIKLLAGGMAEIGYEYVLDRNQGMGAYLFYNFDKNDYSEVFAFTPYYRFYFTDSKEYGARGFFAEPFLSFYSGEQWETTYSNNSGYYKEEVNKYFDTAAGLAIGIKWINVKGFVFEAKAGYGRNLLNENEDTGVFRGDFSVGYRF